MIVDYDRETRAQTYSYVVVGMQGIFSICVLVENRIHMKDLLHTGAYSIHTVLVSCFSLCASFVACSYIAIAPLDCMYKANTVRNISYIRVSALFEIYSHLLTCSQTVKVIL